MKNRAAIARSLLKAAALIEASGKVSAELDEAKTAKIAKTWSEMAKEPVEVEGIKGVAYGTGSELAMLRLFLEYNKMKRNMRTNVGFSKNLNSWYFSLEGNFGF